MRLRTVLAALLTCLAVSMAAVAEPVALEITAEQEDFWAEAITSEDFTALLDLTAAGGASWPNVVQGQVCRRLDDSSTAFPPAA